MRLDHLLSKGEEVEIVSLLDCQGTIAIVRDNYRYLVVMRSGVTPVPIPNTKVKT